MILLSIIIPVYNAAKYISRCLDSVINQSLKNIEVILIDDGSIDESGAICDKYAELDNRIKVVHQKNSGVSAARNIGLDMAVGKYIGFVDSDDWIDTDMFKALLMEAEKSGADVTMCDATTIYSNGKFECDTITQLSESVTLTHDDMSPDLLLEMAGAVWRCIYKNNFNGKRFGSSDIRFPIGLKLSEDRIYNILAIGYASQIRYIKKSYYNRFINKKSAVHRFHSDYFESCKLAALGVSNAIKMAWNNEDAYQIAYLKQFINGAFSAINNYYYRTSHLSSKERIKSVIKVCEDNQLCSAIKKSGCGGLHSRWILNKNLIMLIIYAKLSNLKHGR